MAPFQHIDRPSPFAPAGSPAGAIHLLTPADLEAGLPDAALASFARAAGFKAEAGALLLAPAGEGGGLVALFGLGKAPAERPFETGRLARSLPPGDWRFADVPAGLAEKLTLGFALGAYRFDRYKPASNGAGPVRLVPPAELDVAALERQRAAVYLARDLINTPTNHLLPDQLEAVFRALGQHYGAAVSSIVGDDLLSANFPLVHTVGRASAVAPRLLEMRWGRPGARAVTLVGKGVCFDTGGLDIKPSASMLIMKKDMGGAANVMALALMIMDAGLDVALRVIVPAVENAVAGNAFRPGDIYRSRKGLTVQIDNTDAEGRLILADALAYAEEETPDLLVDMATLTGAARVALGAEVPPFFTRDEALATALAAASLAEDDPLWRLPLHPGYEKDINARLADLTNAPAGGMAGAITAALFLSRFVAQERAHVHLDIYGWAPAERPQGPAGGEAQGIRALYRVIAQG